MIEIKAKEKPKWYNYQWRLSNLFIWIARKIYPANPELNAFMLQMLSDQMIYGQSIVRVNPTKFMDAENVDDV